jgi:hypothetical protein
MQSIVSITVNTLTHPLSIHFGSGAPGWLDRDVPPGTRFDFREGISSGPAGKLVRAPGSSRWARAH